MNNRTGTIYTACRIESHSDRRHQVEVQKVLVDTESEFTWICADTLKKAGISREKKSYSFVTAAGQQITRSVGFAIIQIGETFTVDEVVFGEPGGLELLGARSLRGLNLRVNSRGKKLMAGGPILAA